jgi:branched-chain amino acid transport system ATP-binding protein
MDNAITVLIGPNGSGKSTLLKTLMGLTDIYSGKIFLDDRDLTGTQPHVLTRIGMAYLPQVDNVFTNLSVEENLRMSAYTLTPEEANDTIPAVVDNFPIINEYLPQKAGRLSGGERQMLAMAMAMIRKPKIILFDEPTGSLAPKIAFEVLDKIVELRDENKMTIILAEQNAKRALEHGDEAVLLVSGSIKYQGDSDELLDREDLGRVFLGIQ